MRVKFMNMINLFRGFFCNITLYLVVEFAVYRIMLCKIIINKNIYIGVWLHV